MSERRNPDLGLSGRMELLINTTQTSGRDTSIDLGAIDASMPQKLLDVADITALL